MEPKITQNANQPDFVLANLEWVRALAGKLVGDAASADDLVQEAWLAARSSQPRLEERGGPRPWLAGLLRNLARGKYRQVRSRAAREERAARPESSGTKSSPAELVARSEQLTSVAQHVLALSEPYRRTMLLRWFDGLTPEEVAREEKIQLGTVRTRLHRGRTELKKRLDAENGGDSHPWALALMPFVPRDLPARSASVASALKPVAAAATLLTAGGVAIWLGDKTPGGEDQQDRAVVAAADRTAPVEPETMPALKQVVDTANERSSAAALVAAEETTLPEPPKVMHPLAGRIVIQSGEPVRGALLSAIPRASAPDGTKKSTTTYSDDEGRFSFDGLAAGRYGIGVSTAWALTLEGNTEFSTGDTQLLLKVDAYSVRLRAVDDSGTPVPMASVSMRMLPVDRGTGSSSAGRSQRFDVPKLDHEFTLAPQAGHKFQAKDATGRSYYGMVPAERASGFIHLDLLESPPGFGSVTIRLEHPDLPDGALLSTSGGSRDGEMFTLESPSGIAKGGAVSVDIAGLLPGDYSISMALSESRPVAFKRFPIKVRVDAGSSPTVDMTPYSGGMIELSVRSDDIASVEAARALDAGEPKEDLKPLRAMVWLRPKGDEDWEWLSLERQLPDGSGSTSGPRVRIDGLASLSFPEVEGEYELRVTADGFHPVERSLRLLQGATERIEVDLVAVENR